MNTVIVIQLEYIEGNLVWSLSLDNGVIIADDEDTD